METRGRFRIERVEVRGENKVFTMDVSPKAKRVVGIMISTKLTNDPMPVNRHFYGAAAVPGLYDNAFVNSLQNQQMESTVKVFALNAGALQKIFYARPARLDGLPSFEVNGQSIPFLDPQVISVTDPDTAYVEDYLLWESQDLNLGAVEFYVF